MRFLSIPLSILRPSSCYGILSSGLIYRLEEVTHTCFERLGRPSQVPLHLPGSGKPALIPILNPHIAFPWIFNLSYSVCQIGVLVESLRSRFGMALVPQISLSNYWTLRNYVVSGKSEFASTLRSNNVGFIAR